MVVRILLVAFLASYCAVTSAQESDPTLLGKIISACVDTCNRLYHQRDMCGTEDGQFCAWVHHLQEDDHLKSIASELEAVTNIELAHGDNAINWAMEELVEYRHNHKQLDDHATVEDFTSRVGYICMGMQAYHARQEL